MSTSHTKEPWVEDANYGIIGADNHVVLATDWPLQPIALANQARIVACVNGCAGLNPAAYRKCVEALKNTRSYLIGIIDHKAIIPDSMDAAIHYLREIEDALTHVERTV